MPKRGFCTGADCLLVIWSDTDLKAKIRWVSVYVEQCYNWKTLEVPLAFRWYKWKMPLRPVDWLKFAFLIYLDYVCLYFIELFYSYTFNFSFLEKKSLFRNYLHIIFCRQSISIIDIWLQELGYTIEQEGADQQSLFDLAVAEIWVQDKS